MEISEIKKIVCDEVRYIQELSGRPCPTEIEDSFVPHSELEGFDSLNGTEVAVRIAVKLDCVLSENPFAQDRRPLSIEQVAKRIMAKMRRTRNGNGKK
jgi:hypothetical protein